jgi:hypothetical protein
MKSRIRSILPQVEDAFGFYIQPEDAAGLTTPEKLCDYVLAHRFGAKWDVCLTSVTFYKLRQALVLVLQVPRESVSDSTELTTIIPRHRRRAWRAIERAVGFHLPYLRRPQWVVVFGTLLAVAFGVAVPAALGLRPFGGGILVGMISAALLGLGGLYRLTAPLAFQLPPDAATVGQLARAVLARNYGPIAAAAKKSATEAEVRDVLQGIIGMCHETHA